jgi:hypothetical protein
LADSKVTRKFRVYRHLFHVNNAFRYLEKNLDVLLTNELLERDDVAVWHNRFGELQAEINMNLTGRLHRQESGEIRRLAPLVEKWEEGEIAKITASVQKKKAPHKKRA